ncbi:MAG: hypothetical protein P1U74_06315 [Legionellaceae bacterium]|nr:hypothetical protein [Legionellaceae bacterium]
MEADRFGQNQKYYIIGIICLMLSLPLFAFSFYLFPYLIFDWHYSVPDFVPELSGDLQRLYNLTKIAAGWLMILCCFFSAVILAVIADILSNKIDREIHTSYTDDVVTKTHKRNKVGEPESSGLVFKIIMIIVLVFVASQFFQWALSTAPP